MPALESNLADQVFTTSDVSRIAQISLRQLQWWDERKVVSPRKEEHKRLYLPAELIEIMVVAELRRKGLSLQKIRRVLRPLQRRIGTRLNKIVSSKFSLYLLTNGKSIYLEEGQEGVIDLLQNAREPMWLVCVSDQVKRLASEKGAGRSEKQLALF